MEKNSNDVEVKVFKETEKSYINVKNFLRNVQMQSSETIFLPVKEVMYNKENKKMELREFYGIDTSYTYGFLAKQGILEWNGIRGKSAVVKWCAKENLHELTIRLKTINGRSKKINEIKKNKPSDVVKEEESKIDELINDIDDFPIKEIENDPIVAFYPATLHNLEFKETLRANDYLNLLCKTALLSNGQDLDELTEIENRTYDLKLPINNV